MAARNIRKIESCELILDVTHAPPEGTGMGRIVTSAPRPDRDALAAAIRSANDAGLFAVAIPYQVADAILAHWPEGAAS